MNEKKIHALVFIAAICLHLAFIFFFAFNLSIFKQEEDNNAKVMKLTDITLLLPAVEENTIPQEKSIEISFKEDNPVQEPSHKNILTENYISVLNIETTESYPEAEGSKTVIFDYFPVHMVSTRPDFDRNAVSASLIYPQAALRSGIEGYVILELSVDSSGYVQNVIIYREEPEGRGFGEAAARVFIGRKGIPATVNGENVNCRFRYPVSFRMK